MPQTIFPYTYSNTGWTGGLYVSSVLNSPSTTIDYSSLAGQFDYVQAFGCVQTVDDAPFTIGLYGYDPTGDTWDELDSVTFADTDNGKRYVMTAVPEDDMVTFQMRVDDGSGYMTQTTIIVVQNH